MPYQRHDKDGNAVTAIASYARHDKDGNPVALSKYVRHDKDGDTMGPRNEFQRRDSSNALDSPQPESRTFVDDFGNIYRNYSADYEARDKDGNLLNDYESVFNRTALDLNFAGNKSLIDAVSGDNLITFTRASSGTFVGADGLIKTTPVNLIKYSQQFDQQWTTDSTGTITINHAAAPNGTTTANRFVESTGNSSHAIRQILTVSGTYTVSAHFKELPGSAKRYGVLRIHGVGSTAPIAFFDLGNGTVTSSGGTNIISTSIANVGNGWFRCSMTANEPLLSDDGIQIGVTNTSDSFSSYTGDGSSGLLIWGVQFEEGSTATDYIPTTSTISGAPRFDHNPSTGESLGLLTEESSKNRNTKSKSFSVWGVSSGFSLVYDAATAPDGTTSATALDRNGGGLARLEKNFSVGSGESTTFSVFAKSVNTTTGRYLRLAVNDAQTGERFADFDLVDGTIDDAASNGGNFTNAASRIEKYPNDWYRCSISFSKTSSGSENSLCFHKLYIRQSDNSTNTPSEVTDVGMYIWGGQVEEKTFPTSLIETDGSAVTRAADVAEITGTNFSSFYNQSAGTIFVDNSYIALDDFDFVLDYSDGTLDNRHSLFYLTNTDPITLRGRTRVSSDQSALEVAIPASGVFAKTAYAYASNDFAISSAGSSVLTDTNGSIPTINQLTIGATFANASVYSGHIKRIAYFNTRLSNTILETITS